MDSTLPQMPSIDFDRLDPIALEETLAYLKQHPEPPAEDVALFASYQGFTGLMDDAVQEMDWMAESQDGDQSSADVTCIHILDIPYSAKLFGHQGSKNPTLSSPTLGTLGKDLLVPHSFESSLGGFSAPSHKMHVNGVIIEPPTRLQHLNIDAQFKTSSKRSNCTWAGCQQTADKHDELKAHLESHSLEARALWTSGSKCTWQGCKSKAVFKSISQMKQHLTNIHSDPLMCTQPRCPYRKPFKNQHDLARHTSTKHSVERKWECLYDTCSSEIRTFVRKDKWLKHIREVQHENDAFCPFYHCSRIAAHSGKEFESRKEIGNHFSETHAGKDDGAFECALGSCEMISCHDRWSISGLERHLEKEHRIFLYCYELDEIRKGTDSIFQLQHVRPHNLDRWVDCKICASQTDSSVNTTGPPSSLSGTS